MGARGEGRRSAVATYRNALVRDNISREHGNERGDDGESFHFSGVVCRVQVRRVQREEVDRYVGRKVVWRQWFVVYIQLGPRAASVLLK